MFHPLIFRGTRWFNVSPTNLWVRGHKSLSQQRSRSQNCHRIKYASNWILQLKCFVQLKNSFSCSIDKACYIGCRISSRTFLVGYRLRWTLHQWRRFSGVGFCSQIPNFLGHGMFTELMNYHICFPAKWVGQNNMAKNMGAFNKNKKHDMLVDGTILPRWFKVTFLSPTWRSLNPWKGHLAIPKKSHRIAWGLTRFVEVICTP